MSTEAENEAREALERALSRKVWREDGWEVPAIEVQAALDILAERTRPESDTDWEYGIHHVDVDGWTSTRLHKSRESAESGHSTCGMNCALVRRRKAGPWEVVPDDK